MIIEAVDRTIDLRGTRDEFFRNRTVNSNYKITDFV